MLVHSMLYASLIAYGYGIHWFYRDALCGHYDPEVSWRAVSLLVALCWPLLIALWIPVSACLFIYDIWQAYQWRKYQMKEAGVSTWKEFEELMEKKYPLK